MKRTKFTKAIANFLVMVSMFSAIAVIPKQVEAAGEREASRSSSTTGDRNSSRFSSPTSDSRLSGSSPLTGDRKKDFAWRLSLQVLKSSPWENKTLAAALSIPNRFDATGYARAVFKSSFMLYKTDDRSYVYQLYSLLFDRRPSSEEANYWINRLSKGDSKEYILECFLDSAEFKALAKSLNY